MCIPCTGSIAFVICKISKKIFVDVAPYSCRLLVRFTSFTRANCSLPATVWHLRDEPTELRRQALMQTLWTSFWRCNWRSDAICNQISSRVYSLCHRNRGLHRLRLSRSKLPYLLRVIAVFARFYSCMISTSQTEHITNGQVTCRTEPTVFS